MEKIEQKIYLSLDDDEKENIQYKAQELDILLSTWASGYPVIRARRSAPVSVLISTVLPAFSQKVAFLVGKLILFIFAVDDVADERLLSYEDFTNAAVALDDIARHGRVEKLSFTEDKGLGEILLEIRAELSEFPHFSDLCTLWADRLWGLCQAMAQEYMDGENNKASGGKQLPALDEYVAGGVHSVGFPFWGTSVLIMLNEPYILSRLDEINGVILETGAAIRLYNDVRTYEKELQENNVNAVTIVHRTLATGNPELPMPERLPLAQEIVLHMANQHAKKSYALSNQVLTGTGQFELMIKRIVAFHADFYGSHEHNRDYHTISSADSFSIFQRK